MPTTPQQWEGSYTYINAFTLGVRDFSVSYLLTYNLASGGGPKCPGQSPIGGSVECTTTMLVII